MPLILEGREVFTHTHTIQVIIFIGFSCLIRACTKIVPLGITIIGERKMVSF